MIVGLGLAVGLVLLRYAYGWVMTVRGWLFERGLLKSEAFAVPVIALGNVRVGGTGKSPHAAYVVGLLLAAGYRAALLSRGYGRRSRGFRLVGPTDDAELVGDEPLEQARRFRHALQGGALTVAVAERRVDGIRQLLAAPHPPDVVVLDDAYQHRAVRPSLTVLLTEFHRPFPADRILPLGRLREFARAARRADAVVVTKCPPTEARSELVRGLDLRAIRRFAGEQMPVFFTAYAYGEWQPLIADSVPASPPGPRTFRTSDPDSRIPIVVLTAIDNPAPLLEYLLGRDFLIAEHVRFPDHHAFTDAELAGVRAASDRNGRCPVVTTGKDATRLLAPTGEPRPELAGVAVWWVPVAVREVPITEAVAPASLRQLVLDHVAGFGARLGQRVGQSAGRAAAAVALAALSLLGAPTTALAQSTPPTTPPAGQLAPAAPADGKPKKPRRILNDSAQTRYGAKTTAVFTEADLLRGRPRPQPVDTAFREFWNPRRWYHDSSTFQQDLGNVGSAARPLVWPVGVPQAGIRWGRRAFDRYAYDPAVIPYYDTRSPFSSLAYIQGARGEQVFEGRYTRNVKRALNFGGAYQRLSANKQFATTLPKDNYLTHAAFNTWATYGTADSVWRVLASYAHMSHEVVEQGPVLADPTDSAGLYANTPVALAFATNREFRNSWRLTNLVRLAGPGLQLFYTFDRRVQRHRFADTDLQFATQNQAREHTFFPAMLLDTIRTQDDARFRLNQHTAGVLGTARFGAYRIYAARRDARYQLYFPGGPVAVGAGDAAASAPRQVGRLAVGGEAGFRVRDVVSVTVDGELQSGDNTHWLRATGRFRFLTVSQLRNGYAPTITENALYGNHFRWENDFRNTQRDETRASVVARVGCHRLWLDGALTRVRNLVYFDALSRPRQETTTLTLGTVQARWRGQFNWLRTDVRAAYTALPGRAAAVIRTPPLLADVLLYYEGPLVKKSLFGQAGVQVYSQADARTLGWQPATQQFVLQDRQLVRTYPQVDVFLAADLRNVNLFLKMAHVNQGLPRNGYYVTAGYPQLRRSFTFGVKWLFFD